MIALAIIFTVATDAGATDVGNVIGQFVSKYYRKIVNKIDRVFDNVVATDAGAHEIGAKISKFTLKFYEVFKIESVHFSNDDLKKLF